MPTFVSPRLASCGTLRRRRRHVSLGIGHFFPDRGCSCRGAAPVGHIGPETHPATAPSAPEHHQAASSPAIHHSPSLRSTPTKFGGTVPRRKGMPAIPPRDVGTCWSSSTADQVRIQLSDPWRVAGRDGVVVVPAGVKIVFDELQPVQAPKSTEVPQRTRAEVHVPHPMQRLSVSI